MGKDLAADLKDLLLAARVELPKIAEAYLEANRYADQTADISLPGSVPLAWGRLRDKLQQAVGETAENLTDTARALEAVVQAYASTDDEAAAELKRIIEHSTFEDQLSRPRYQDLPSSRMPGE